ncbi:MAG: hypothetical protein JJE50_14390 [Actinomycetales bacterium]|nr:hypothetical protein [Actinomycetales bacterium]
MPGLRREELARLAGHARAGPAHARAHQRPRAAELELGLITLDCDNLQLPDAEQRVIIYAAEPGSPAAEALALLKVVGTQDLTSRGAPNVR